MGFCMTCTNTGKNCGYTTWFNHRVEIVKIVVKYLENKIAELQKEIEEKSNAAAADEEQQINGLNIEEVEYYIQKSNEYFIQFKHCKNDDAIFAFISNPQIYHIKDALSYFGIYGAHLLCRQSDCGGVYTVGESFEILHMLNIIKPAFDESSEIYETVYSIQSEFSSSIYDIFEDSVTSLQPIRIT
jgi:hypothetical protein